MASRTTEKTQSARPAKRANAVKGTAPVGNTVLGKLRKDWGLTAKDFARITGFSERAIAAWGAGSTISPPAHRRLVEVQRLLKSLAELVKEGSIPAWLHTPNGAFGGLKPLEVIERGETDRLWRMLFYLESGVAV